MPPIGLGDPTHRGVPVGTVTTISAAPAAQGSQGRRRGRSRLRRSFGTFGSIFSQGEAAPTRPTIGQPFDFRREGGGAESPEAPENAITVQKTVTITSAPIESFSAADSSPGQSAASTLGASDSGLLRPRPATRRGNRSSLPVSSSNVASPSNDSQLRGAEVIASYNTTGYHQFRSPPSTGLTIHRAPSVIRRIPASASLTTTSERARTVGFAARMSQNTIEISFWVSIVFAQSSYTAATSCLALVTYSSHDVEESNAGALHGMIISLVGLLISGACLTHFYSQRIGERTTIEYDGSRIGKLLRMTVGQIGYWTSLCLLELSFTSLTGAITIVLATVNDSQGPSVFSLVWLTASAAVFVIIGIAFVLLAAYRMTNRRVLGFRYRQQLGDEEIELQPITHRNYSMPIQDTARMADDIEFSAADDADRNARNAARQNDSTTRSQGFPTIQTDDQGYNDLSRDIDHPDQSTVSAQHDDDENIDASEIGLAYSDSTTPRRNEVSLSSMSPDIIEDMRPSSSVYNSGGSIERLSNIRQASSPFGDSPPRLHLDSSIYSAEQMSIVSLPRNAARLVESRSAGTSGLPDGLSTSRSPTGQSGTQGASPIVDFGGTTSPASTHHDGGFAIPRKPMERSHSMATLGPREEGPVSDSVRAMPAHDALRGKAQMQPGHRGTRHRRNAPIVVPRPADNDDDDDSEWWAPSRAPAPRRGAMTPIEERSEADQSARSSAALSG
ncbi:hypothetical protein BJ166DRAFT_607413 [Pestalotiopsis sp. NC0098]|nr:hypothetical protein BJ166DRAFT_607413 [Pestalotiopsis sp. NC0098]